MSSIGVGFAATGVGAEGAGVGFDGTSVGVGGAGFCGDGASVGVGGAGCAVGATTVGGEPPVVSARTAHPTNARPTASPASASLTCGF